MSARYRPGLDPATIATIEARNADTSRVQRGPSPLRLVDPYDEEGEDAPSKAPLVGLVGGAGAGLAVGGPIGAAVGGLLGWLGGRRLSQA